MGDVNNLKNRLSSSSRASIKHICEQCALSNKEKVAKWFCKNCKKYYCARCMELHEISKHSRYHLFTSTDDTNVASDVMPVPFSVENEKFFTVQMVHGSDKTSKVHKSHGVEKVEALGNKSLLCEPPFAEMDKEEKASSNLRDGFTTSLHHAKKKTTDQNLYSEDEQLKMPDEKTFHCEPCTNQNFSELAVAFCDDCDEFLCPRCKGMHLAMKNTKGHSLLTIWEYCKKNKNVLCEPCQFNGSNEEAKYYCMDCPETEPLCVGCSRYHTAQKCGRGHKLSTQIGDLMIAMKEDVEQIGGVNSALREEYEQ